MRVHGRSLALTALLGVWLTAPGMLRAQSGASPPADTTAKKPDPPPPPVNHLETALAGFKLTGYAAGSYAYSGRSSGDTAIVGRLYDRLQNRFMLNALAVVRSEEHTSELQSHHDLVCRLLLEKKKNTTNKTTTVH